MPMARIRPIPRPLGHGDLISDNGPGPIELYASYGGTGEGRATISEMTRILFKEDFPPHMRWSRFQNLIPPRRDEAVSIQDANWVLQAQLAYLQVGRRIGRNVHLDGGRVRQLIKWLFHHAATFRGTPRRSRFTLRCLTFRICRIREGTDIPTCPITSVLARCNGGSFR
jgi:hypothetical protein